MQIKLLGNDTLAYQVLGNCRQRGIKVPDDISVMGLGNDMPSAISGIELSTVSQEPYLTGQKAGELLLDLLSGKTPAQRQIIIPGEVILRSTTKAI